MKRAACFSARIFRAASLHRVRHPHDVLPNLARGVRPGLGDAAGSVAQAARVDLSDTVPAGTESTADRTVDPGADGHAPAMLVHNALCRQRIVQLMKSPCGDAGACGGWPANPPVADGGRPVAGSARGARQPPSELHREHRARRAGHSHHGACRAGSRPGGQPRRFLCAVSALRMRPARRADRAASAAATYRVERTRNSAHVSPNARPA